MTAIIHEDRCIELLTATLARSPLQANGTGESDAELVRLPGRDLVLAITTDSIVEEVEAGLYADPELIGWMTVTVNLSDLAAVGASPLGILLNLTLRPGCSADFLAAFRGGVDAACRANHTTVLGGDTNFSSQVQFGGTAVGLIEGGPPVTRRGARPGDVLLASGPLGAGSAFALERLRLGSAGHFRPLPRLDAGVLLRRFASCAMDTSDGLLPALDQLQRVNGRGFEVDLDAPDLLHPDADELARAHGIPPWVMLAGPHGEFELVFTVAHDHLEEFRREAARIGWEPVRLGRVLESARVDLVRAGDCRTIDTAAVRGLAETAASDVDRYVDELRRLGS